MSEPDGYNPMRWDCDKRGCFNKKQRPKIEQFAECFPGKIAFGDVDAIVEINGHGLMLEWKCDPMEIGVGQRIMHERLTKTGLLTVICVAGDAETMAVTHRATFFMGVWHAWTECDMDGLKASIRKWVEWAKGCND